MSLVEGSTVGTSPSERLEVVLRLGSLYGALRSCCATSRCESGSRRLPGYRLSKFQDCLPERYALEVIEGYLLDVERTVLWLTGAREA